MKHQYGTKSTFVRLNPSLTAKDVVKLAKTQGIKLSLSYVYGIRCAARKQSISIVEARRVGRQVRQKLFGLFSTGPEISPHPVRDPNAADTQLRQLFTELGLIRSRGIVDEMERRVA